MYFIFQLTQALTEMCDPSHPLFIWFHRIHAADLTQSPARGYAVDRTSINT